MISYVDVFDLRVSTPLYELVIDEVLPGLNSASGGMGGLDSDFVWQQLSEIVHDLVPKNREILKKRDYLQEQIDAYHISQRGSELSERKQFNSPEQFKKYKIFLTSIGYLEPEVNDFEIDNGRIDTEITSIAGPQLVVPINDARFVLNAANARWGSLYNALYGTDAIEDKEDKEDVAKSVHKGKQGEQGEQGKELNPNRSRAAIEWANSWLDDVVPLESGGHQDVVSYEVVNNELVITLKDKTQTKLRKPSQFIGFQDKLILFRQHGLHIELQIDPDHPIGKFSPAGVKDMIIESAVTTICDCEDSVAAIDGFDKTRVYRNWLGLMRGDLCADIQKGDKVFTRRLNPDRHYHALDGSDFSLPGRSLLLIRDVGHLMTTPAVLLDDGSEIFEGILDAFMTSLIAMYDLQGHGVYQNSKEANVYIVKPKMHGSEEVAFACEIFDRVEQAFGLAKNTIKMGIMDEERRTTVNLKNCIQEAKSRVMFINTGFLDRTGDEIHTSMEAGPFLPKDEIKKQAWIHAYEDWNVDVGLACGLGGKAQIGKGMWAMPELMAQMLEQKIAHLEAGANCAWVPSPTAATLHATHYHRVDVAEVQKQLVGRAITNKSANLDDILTIPLLISDTKVRDTKVRDIGELDQEHLDQERLDQERLDQERLDQERLDQEYQEEIDNNVQSILGYVVRWIDNGIGCSKVPDIHDVALMEDRATLRISSQLLANWLHHGLCTKAQVEASFKRMAVIVDKQNAADPTYHPMGPSFSGIAYQSALALVIEGRNQPNGYTEPLLHSYRKKLKTAHHIN